MSCVKDILYSPEFQEEVKAKIPNILMHQVLNAKEMKFHGSGCHCIPFEVFLFADCLSEEDKIKLSKFCNKACNANDEVYVTVVWIWDDYLDCPIIIRMSFVSESELKGFVRC